MEITIDLEQRTQKVTRSLPGQTTKRILGFCSLTIFFLLSGASLIAQDRGGRPDEKDPFKKCKSPGITQAPALPGGQPISSRDRVYAADQTSNTVSVIDPSTNLLLGTIALGAARPDNLLDPNYIRQIDVHGLGFSNDGSMLAVVSATTNAVTIIQTATNRILGTVYLGRAPHEAVFTPDCREIWVAVRGENYVSVIDVARLQEVDRIPTSDGASKVVFRADGKVAFVDSTRTPELVVVDVKSHRVLKRIALQDTFTSDMATSPDGREVWLPHKMSGTLTIVDAQNFRVLGEVAVGREVNHPNFVSKPAGDFAYVTVGGENVVKVYRRNGGSPQLVATIPTGGDPHGIWPSPDNSRIYVVLQHGDAVQVIDTARDAVINTIKAGQDGQALVYVANAVPVGNGREGLTMQNVALAIQELKLMVSGGGKATVVLRGLVGVDSVEVSAEELQSGAKYNVFAVKSDNTRQLIGDFTADAEGKGMVDPLLKFFEAGFVRVEVARAP